MKLFNRLPIGRKLQLVNLSSAIVALLVSSVLLIEKNNADLEEQLESRIDKASRIVAANIQAAVIFEDWEMAEEVTRPLLQDTAVRMVTMTDARGELRVQVGSTVRGAVGRTLETPIMDESTILGRIRVTYSRNEVLAALNRAVVETLALIAIAATLALVVSNRVQSYVTTPLNAIVSLVKDLSKTKNYKLRATKVHPDEVGVLADNLNSMLEMIEQRDQYLEQQVQERTADLHEQNVLRQQVVAVQMEMRKRFEQAFNNAPIGMALVDADENLFQRNETLNRMLCLEADAPVNLQALMGEDNYEEFAERFEQHRAGSLPNFEMSVTTRVKEQAKIQLEVSLGDVCDEQGEFLYSVMQVQDVTASAELSRQLQYQAGHDELTSLANRRSLEHVISRVGETAQAGQVLYSLCMIDLDRFKLVNDTSGHAAGDALLVEIARLLESEVRADDTVVRMGGDEFALFLRGCPTSVAVEVCERIRDRIHSMLFRWDDHAHTIGASIGIKTVMGPDVPPHNLVLQQADTACFTAKESGRGRVVVFDQQSEEIRKELGELNWVQRINKALENDDFCLYVQEVAPLQAAPADVPQHVEVLLRLRDPVNQRILSPGAFLPVAERYGHQVQIDQWVVEHTLKASKVYEDFFDESRQYWINLSGASICNAEFVDYVTDLIHEMAPVPGSINFEITETAVISNLTHASYALERFRELGCRLALDDFGTGVSSFSYLKKLPVDFVKIDGVFVRNVLEDEVNLLFIKSIVEIAHAMGKQVIVEFVENKEVLELMRSIGADYAQGFEIDRPRELRPRVADEHESKKVLWG